MKHTFTLLSFLFLIYCNSAKAQAIEKADSLALVDLYNSTQGNAWTNHDNWLTASPVTTWYGIVVSCNRVSGIDLGVNNLSGMLPSSMGNLAGLQYLYLYNNELRGAIPSSFSQLTHLKELLTGDNYLSGSIPSSLGKLKDLQQLDVSNNRLSGTVPFAIGNLAGAQYINLSNNKLTGQIPVTIGKLAGVRILQMSGNMLNGQIPAEIGNLGSLQYLYLQNNKLSGMIPSSIGNLQSLQVLYIDGNKLSGSLTNGISSLANLQLLSLSHNQITGIIPSSFSHLSKLTQLYLNNNELRGAIPFSFIHLTNLQYLHLEYNHLSQGANKSPVLPLNVFLNADISHNDFTFDGMEFLATHYPFVTYNSQASLLLHKNGEGISLYAGGTLSNNSYTWYKTEDRRGKTTVQGDSLFHPASAGHYYAQVRNDIATQLVLYTDTFEYAMPADRIIASLPGVRDGHILSVYPNPARDIVYIRTEGSAVITITDANGKTMLLKTVTGNDVMDVSRFSPGIYHLQNQATGEVQKLVVVR